MALKYVLCQAGRASVKDAEWGGVGSEFLGPGSAIDVDAITEMVRQLIDRVVYADKVVAYIPPSELSRRLSVPMPEYDAPLSAVWELLLDEIDTGAIRQHHPRFLAFPDSGNAVAAILADLAIPILNQNLIATAKSAPTGTFAELQVLRWMRQLIGYMDHGPPREAIDAAAIVVAGGVSANAVAMLGALNYAYPESRAEGLWTIRRPPAVFVAGDLMFHYSHLAACWWLGIGERSVVPVDVRSDYTMDPSDLARKLNQAERDGRQPVAVIAQAGDSRTMAIDPLHDLADLADQHDTWLHVDACHGGALVLSDHLRARVAGIERAASVTLDPHKVLCIPYTSSLLFLRDRALLAPLAKATDITIARGSFDLGQVTPFAGSRRFESLKLWFVINHLGRRRLAEIVESRCHLAELWQDLVTSSARMTPLNEVTINAAVFSVAPIADGRPRMSLDRLNRVNRAVHDKVHMDGQACIHSFDLIDVGDRLGYGPDAQVLALRVVVGNPLTTERELLKAFGIVEQATNEMLRRDIADE